MRKRFFPDAQLKEPVKKFEDTFSAKTVILDAFSFKTGAEIEAERLARKTETK